MKSSELQRVSTEELHVPASKKDVSCEIFYNEGLFNRLKDMAGMMAKSGNMLPAHFKGDVGACMAVQIQALQWEMNPFAVAQKSHNVQGKIAYEAQLVNAVIQKTVGIKEPAFKYEFIGDWDAILNSTPKKIESKKKEGSFYFVRGWTDKDEATAGVIVSATLEGEDEPRTMKLLLKQCTVRNSTNWTNDPQQQICYRALQKWSRLYCPGAILGVYSRDEMSNAPQAHKIQPQPDDIDASVEEVQTITEEQVHYLVQALEIAGYKEEDLVKQLKNQKIESLSEIQVDKYEAIKKYVDGLVASAEGGEA